MQELFLSHINSSKNAIEVASGYFQKFYHDKDIFDQNIGIYKLTGVLDNSSSIYNKPINLNKYEYALVIGEPTVEGSPFKSTEEFSTFVLDDKKLVKTLDGDFTILLINSIQHDISIYTSKLGLLPLYLYQLQDDVILSSRLGILHQVVDKIGINKGALMQQCLYNYCISDQTIFENVTLLPSASVVEITDGKKKSVKYWSVIEEMERHPLNRKESVACINNSLDNIIRDLLNNQNHVAISLTGGWDGRLILAYALKYLSTENIQLYSFGTRDAPDVFLPERTSKKLGYNYLPVYLDSEDYQKQIVRWAKETAFNSDGMRSVKRSHYMFAMDLLGNSTDVVISGNGGSNLIKSSKLAPSNVFNKYVLEVVFSKDRFETARQQYQILKSKYSPLFDDIAEENFLQSFKSEELDWLYTNFENEKRLVVYLTGDIERKYFGFEIQSYRHLIKNKSPFFDMRFIRDLSKTIFFGGYDYDQGKLTGLKNARFYAKLVYQNNVKLSKELTDRGFSLFDLLFPINPMIPFNYKKAKGLGNTGQLDYFQNKDLLDRLISFRPNEIQNLYAKLKQDDVVSNHITVSEFLNQLN